MPAKEIHAVTGAFGFLGRYIAGRLLDTGCQVVTLTNSRNRPDPFGEKITVRPLRFDRADELENSLRNASVLYNTYFVRFNYRGNVSFTFADAVRNSGILFRAAKRAGVRRVVHISITNPSEHSELEYFRSKARIERLLTDSGFSCSILRPALLFGDEGILVNNIAWLLRRFPFFCIFGDGRYRLQPIHVDDLAELAVREGKEETNAIIDAIGPETFSYRELVKEIGRNIGKPRPVIPVPPNLGLLASNVIGAVLRDRLVTREEIKGLMAELLYVDSPPVGKTSLTGWVAENAAWLGTRYFNEIERRAGKTKNFE
jgi:NADH dehydrogenase